MDEFIENFNEFRAYLNNYTCATPDEAKVIEKIRNKFDELGLNDAF